MGEYAGKLTPLTIRKELISLVTTAVNNGARKSMACMELGISLRTIERWQEVDNSIKVDQRQFTKNIPSNKLTAKERARVVSIVTSPAYKDLPPLQIVPMLADQKQYIASESTIYRILRENKLNAYRGKAKPPVRKKPEPYIANNPNEVWSWDITYLARDIKGKFFYLYLILDIFSRKIVGFEVHECESAKHAAHLAASSYAEEKINGKELILHSDNGSPMKGATMLATLNNLGISPSYSRPSVSNDNPYSEAMFKTLKYCPQYPEKPFSTIEEARGWVIKFVAWYNNEHHHSAIKFVTPSQRHNGSDISILENRTKIYKKAKDANPSRWSKNIRDWSRVNEVYLNPGKGKTIAA